MSEKLFRFLLNELKTIRVHCGHCSVTVEIEIDLLEQKFKTRSCPVCQEKFELDRVPNDYNPFRELAKVAEFFEAVKDQVTVEFTIQDKE